MLSPECLPVKMYGRGVAPLGVQRRLTPCQNAALQALNALSGEESDKVWQSLIVAHRFGELAPMLRLCQDLKAHRLPVSPTDFQNSVANTVASAICRATHFTGPCVTFSASPDASIHMYAAVRRSLILKPFQSVLGLIVFEDPHADLAIAEAALFANSPQHVVTRTKDQPDQTQRSIHGQSHG